jgi:hypothetical protein
MAKEIIRRTARDNVYLHKDFHGALSAGIEYLDRNFGEESVRQYLRQFAVSYYAPLIEAVRDRGLLALSDHFAKVYHEEGAEVRMRLTEDDLFIELDACPAVTHMRKHGYAVARLFHETTRTVNEALCESTPFAAELLDYDQETGRSVQHFHRRTP